MVHDLGLNLETYLPVLVFFGLAIIVSTVFVILPRLRAPHRPDANKTSPYECGFDAFEDTRRPFDVHFYLVSILFIIFDLEIAFLFPWAITLSAIGIAGFCSMLLFLTLLTVGFIYEWKKGALDWE